MEQKQCSNCNQFKSFNEFANRQSAKDGKEFKCKQCCKIIRQTDARQDYNKQYRENNKEKIIGYREKYKLTRHKINLIKGWKKQGIRCEYFDALYNVYLEIENCYLCKRKFENNQQMCKCLDHDHLSGYPRFICCKRCNSKLYKIDNKRKNVLLEMHKHFINNLEKFYLC